MITSPLPSTLFPQKEFQQECKANTSLIEKANSQNQNIDKSSCFLVLTCHILR